jgi:hypothetical protein
LPDVTRTFKVFFPMLTLSTSPATHSIPPGTDSSTIAHWSATPFSGGGFFDTLVINAVV